MSHFNIRLIYARYGLHILTTVIYIILISESVFVRKLKSCNCFKRQEKNVFPVFLPMTSVRRQKYSGYFFQRASKLGNCTF